MQAQPGAPGRARAGIRIVQAKPIRALMVGRCISPAGQSLEAVIRRAQRRAHIGANGVSFPNDRPSQNAESKDERAERLAAALRENLKRRKAQARAKEQPKEAAKESG